MNKKPNKENRRVHVSFKTTLASAALFIGAGAQVSGIWQAANTRLVAANTAAS
jgi:hypothetical protein